MLKLTSGWTKFMKMIFVFNNFLFLLIGLTAIGFGLWGFIQGEKVFKEDWFPQIDNNGLQKDFERNIKHGFTWLIVGAIVLVGISFLGFCGGMKENRCILAVFFVILFILTLVFIGALVIFYAAPELIEKAIDDGVAKQKTKYVECMRSSDCNSTIVDENVESLQTKFSCCLWNETFAENNTITTCFDKWASASTSKPDDAVFHEKHCSEALIEFFKNLLNSKKIWFALIVIVVLFICAIQMILSLYICCKIKSQVYETMK